MNLIGSDNMRYFKYNGTKTTENVALKARYAELAKKEKRFVRKEKVLNAVALIVFFAGGIVLSGLWFSILELIPEAGNSFETVLQYIGKGIFGFAGVIVSLIIAAIIALAISGKTETPNYNIKKEMLSEACEHLREYYRLCEPCLVTKCYESSDKKFSNHDVCIFVADNELRITVNLKHGFFRSENDLGCYAFKKDEISLSSAERDNLRITLLKADGTFFMLGFRAKSFIERNFTGE